jgi:riboflavin biosynthesis pyrimidine reductase
MASSVDGRIISENWGDKLDKYVSLYERCHNSFKSDAWMIGRVSMEKDFTEGRKPELAKPQKPIPRQPFVGDKNATSFAIAVDPHGKLGWDENQMDGEHVIEILSESVQDEYLQYLQNINVSYFFAGKNTLDFSLALTQLHDVFGIKTLMLEGGGNINGSLLNAGLIDELSILILPLADGTINIPTTFDINENLPKKGAVQLKLLGVERLDYDAIWLTYSTR